MPERAKRASPYFWRFLREFVLPHRMIIFFLMGNILLRVGLGFWWPFASKTMVDQVLVAHFPAWEILVGIIFIGYVLIVANNALIFVFNRILFRLLMVITQRARTHVADHLLKLPQAFYDASHAGRLLTTAVADPGVITHTLTAGMINALANTLVILGGYVILLHMNALLTLAISAVFPGIVTAFFILRPKMIALAERIRENWGIISGMVAERIAAVRVVRSFAAEATESGRFRDRVLYHRDLHVEYNRHAATYGFVNGISIHMGYMIVFLLGGWLYLQGRTTLGTVVAFYGYFQALWPAVIQICNIPQMIASASGSLTKVFRLLDQPLEIASPPGAPWLDEPIREIAFENVSFRYASNLPWALRDVNLVLNGRQHVGIAGPSGSGKSTLMALLLRYYEPVQGRILINGRPLPEWNLASVRRALAVVPQEIVLFSGTIRENILYTREHRDDETISKALERAEAAEFVSELKDGLDSRIGERGVSLSGGQKQRLSIARAFLANPQVLIMDNCTSALDGETEQRLLASLRETQKEGGALIITHRVASIMHCQRILVMDSGQIVEDGSPHALLEARGYFAGIHARQTQFGPATIS